MRGASAVVVAGPAGEGALLSADEHRALVEAAVGTAGGRVPVIAGVPGNRARFAIELARAAEQAGATALLAAAPFHVKPGPAGHVAHVHALHDAVGVPVILQDGPMHGSGLDDVTVRRLADLPRIAGHVEPAGDSLHLVRLRRRLKPGFLLLSEAEASQAAFHLAGGDGCVSVAATLVPALLAALHEACAAGLEGDVVWHERLLAPLFAVLARLPPAQVAKRALCRMSWIGDGTRLPTPPPTPDFERQLARVLEALLPLEAAEARRRAAAQRAA